MELNSHPYLYVLYICFIQVTMIPVPVIMELTINK